MPLRALRLVVVDDHADCGASLALLLRKVGHNASMCRGGREALEELRGTRPDALLVDLGMPGINGFDLAAVIRELYPDMPLFAVTGFADSRSRQLADEAGFHFFFPKPVDFGRLMETLAELSAAPMS